MIGHFEEISNSLSLGYYYPPEVERQILEFMKSYDFDKASDMLNTVYSINFNERNLEPPMVDYLFNNIISTLCKFQESVSAMSAIHYINNSNLTNMLNHDDNIEKKQSTIAYIISVFKNSFISEESDKGTALIKSVKKYIKLNFNNPEVNVSVMAMYFEIRQDYLSRIFKQQTGIGLLDYLNTTRLNEAARLLSSEDTSISEISKMSGFYNYRTFSRQFTKHFGISPQAYRDTNRKK